MILGEGVGGTLEAQGCGAQTSSWLCIQVDLPGPGVLMEGREQSPACSVLDKRPLPAGVSLGSPQAPGKGHDGSDIPGVRGGRFRTGF